MQCLPWRAATNGWQRDITETLHEEIRIVATGNYSKGQNPAMHFHPSDALL